MHEVKTPHSVDVSLWLSKYFSRIILDQDKDTQTRFGILINAANSVFLLSDNLNQDKFSFPILLLKSKQVLISKL